MGVSAARALGGVLIALVCFAGISSTASANYSSSAPKYDDLLNLRVAQQIGALGGPGNGWCEEAGYGVLIYMSDDHRTWWNSPAGKNMRRAYSRAKGVEKLCNWVSSSAVQTQISGLITTLETARRADYMQKLQRGLKEAKCRLIEAGIKASPAKAVPTKILRSTISSITGSYCRL